MSGVHIDQYEAHLTRRNYRKNYIEAQKRTLKHLGKFMQGADILRANTLILTAYLDSRKLGPGSVAAEIAHLRAFYGWAVDQNLIPKDPARRLARPRLPRRLPRPMPDDAIALGLKEAKGRVLAILAFAFYSGLRACEIAQLRAEDLDDDLIIIQESKGGGMSTVPLTPELDRILVRCELPRTGWLFPRADGCGQHISSHMVSTLANEHLHDLGIKHSLHSLRHAYLTHLYRRTKDLLLTRDLGRHRSVASTEGYTLLEVDARAAALASLPRLV